MAKDAIGALARGIEKLEENPDFYKRYEPANGWGSYDGFLEQARRCLDACEKNPLARIHADR